jgi:hypothetical protein
MCFTPSTLTVPDIESITDIVADLGSSNEGLQALKEMSHTIGKDVRALHIDLDDHWQDFQNSKELHRLSGHLDTGSNEITDLYGVFSSELQEVADSSFLRLVSTVTRANKTLFANKHRYLPMIIASELVRAAVPGMSSWDPGSRTMRDLLSLSEDIQHGLNRPKLYGTELTGSATTCRDNIKRVSELMADETVSRSKLCKKYDTWKNKTQDPDPDLNLAPAGAPAVCFIDPDSIRAKADDAQELVDSMSMMSEWLVDTLGGVIESSDQFARQMMDFVDETYGGTGKRTLDVEGLGYRVRQLGWLVEDMVKRKAEGGKVDEGAGGMWI